MSKINDFFEILADIVRRLDIMERTGGGASGGSVDINGQTEKVAPANDDVLLIEDSADSYSKKKVKISNLPGGAGSGVSSVFGRTGGVVAQSGDYEASEVTNAFDKTADDMDDIPDGATYVKTENNYTDAEKTKLSGVEAGAEVNPSNAEVKVAYEANTNTNAFTDSEQTKLANVEDYATADQSDAEIKTAYENNADTNAYTDAEKTKLTGIEAGAEVNVGEEYTTAEQSKLAGIESGATADQSGSEIKVAYEGEADTNAFTDAEKTKLSGVETGATADQSDAEIETAYNNQVPLVSQAEAEAGTSTVRKGWTPERVKQAIDALGGGGSGGDPLTTQDMRGFMAQCNTTTQSVSSGSWQKITTAIGTEDFDTDGWFDNTTNYRFQPDEAGYYLVGGLFTVQNLGDGKKAIAGIYKNGSLYGLLGRGTVGGTDYAGFGGAMMVYMNGSTDYLEMYGYHNHGSNLNTGGSVRYTHFWGMKMEAGIPPAKDYASFYLSTGGLTGISSTALTLVINNTGVNSDTDVFTLASNEVTIDKAGDFKIDYNVYLNNSSTSRTEYSMWLEVDTGSGYAEVAGSRVASYQRGYDSGMSSGGSLIMSVTSGDKFRLRVQRTDGASTAGYQDANGTRLNFVEV